MGGAFQGRQGYLTTPIYISQRLVPDSGVRLLCMEPAGGRGIARSSPHTALDCTRPSKIKPTLLSASHNPQGGDDLDCPVKSMWSLLFLPKPCVCVSVCVCACRGCDGTACTAWSARGLMSEPRTPPHTRVVPVFWKVFLSEVGGTIATAMGLLSCGSKLIGFRLRAAVMTLSTGDTTSRSLPCLLKE